MLTKKRGWRKTVLFRSIKKERDSAIKIGGGVFFWGVVGGDWFGWGNSPTGRIFSQEGGVGTGKRKGGEEEDHTYLPKLSRVRLHRGKE